VCVNNLSKVTLDSAAAGIEQFAWTIRPQLGVEMLESRNAGGEGTIARGP